jgi:hypothetical protein
MDYSEYLRQKKLSQKTYIHRQQFMDAGLHTYIKQKAADSYYVSPNSNPAVIHPTGGCCPTHESLGSTEVTPVKPASGCESAGACAQLSNVYTTPYIELPCCPINYGPSNSYKNYAVIGGQYCYQAPPAQQKAASALAVSRDMDMCCSSMVAIYGYRSSGSNACS